MPSTLTLAALILLRVTVTDDDGYAETQVISLIVEASMNDPGSFTGDASATGSEDDSAITGTLVFY